MKIYNSITQNCNLSCKYCIQSQFTQQQKQKVSYEALNNLPELGEMVFFGGEPLLNQEAIFDTIRYLELMGKKYKFSLITNGKLLTMPLVKNLNKYSVATTVSWDGKDSINLRGFDVLSEKSEEYFSLDNRGISATISALNFNYYEIFESLLEVQNKFGIKDNENINFAHIFDSSHSTPKNLILYNNAKFETMLDEFFSNFKKKVKARTLKGSFESIVLEPRIMRLISALDNKGKWTLCGSDSHMVHMDIAGNLYECHNNQNKIGNIVKDGVKCGSKNKYKDSFMCKSCPIGFICNGGCAIVPVELKKYHCYPLQQEFGRLIDTIKEIENEDYC